MLFLHLFAIAIFNFVAAGDNSYSSRGCSVSESHMHCKAVFGNFIPRFDTQNVHFIFITDSDLRDVTADDFSHFPEVNVIEIRGSNFSFPQHNGLFRNQRKLDRLRIENCDVGDEVAATFMENHFLERLSLRNNRITSVSRTFLSNMTHLHELDLNNNSVTQVEDGALENAPKLDILDLKNNALDVASETVVGTRSDRCSVCRPRWIFAGCSEEEVKLCQVGLPLDRLWWRSPGLTFHLEGNPLCNRTWKPVETEPSRGPYRGNMECYVQEEDCLYQENRRLFLRKACGIKETNRVDIIQEITVEKVSVKNVSFIAVAAVLAGFVIGIMLPALYCRRQINAIKSQQRSDRTSFAELLKGESSEPV